MNTDYKTRRQQRLLSILWKVLLRYCGTCLAILLLFPLYQSWHQLEYHNQLTGFILEDMWRVLEYMVFTLLPDGLWIAILIGTAFFSFTALGVRWFVLMIRRII